MEITPAELQEMACGIFGSIYVFPHVYMAQIMQYSSRKYRLHTHIIAVRWTVTMLYTMRHLV